LLECCMYTRWNTALVERMPDPQGHMTAAKLPGLGASCAHFMLGGGLMHGRLLQPTPLQ